MATSTQPPAGPERRRDLRVAWRKPVHCVHVRDGHEERVPAETENISAGGAVLVKDQPIAVGDTVIVELVDDDPPLSLRRLGQIVRDCGRRDHGYRYAVAFEPLSPQGRAQLTASLIVAASREGRQRI